MTRDPLLLRAIDLLARGHGLYGPEYFDAGLSDAPGQLRQRAVRICQGGPNLVGKDMRDFRDANGLPFASIMMEAAKTKGEGTLRFSFLKGSVDKTPRDKIAYFRGFKPWHIMIGAAEYM